MLVRRSTALGVYYGWIVVGACGILILCACPGQSFGVAVYTDEFLEMTNLSRTTFSISWACVLFCVSMLLPVFGKLCDSWGTRRVLQCITLPFATAVALLSIVNSRYTFLPVLFATRLLGPGVLVLIGTTAVNKFFVQKRGRATSVLNLIVALETAYPTYAIFLRNLTGSWRHSFWVIAASVLVSLGIANMLLHDTPEQVGLKPDGLDSDNGAAVLEEKAEKNETAEAADAGQLEGVTVQAAMRYPVFWALCTSIGLTAFFWTGINLHSIAVFKSHGLPETAMAHAYLLTTIFTLLSTVVAGVVMDSLTDKKLRVMSVSLFFGALANGALYTMRSQTDALLFGTLYGVFAGTLNTCTMVCFADLFGRAHVGAINGVITMIFQGMGGFGPLSFSLVADHFHAFDGIFLFNAVAMTLYAVAIFVVPWQRPKF